MPVIGNLKGPAGPAGPTGPTGPSGAAGTPGTQIFTGTTTPANTTGNDNDLFINTSPSGAGSGDLLKKVAGAW